MDRATRTPLSWWRSLLVRGLAVICFCAALIPDAHSAVAGVYSLAISPAGKVLASGRYYEVQMWDFESGKQLALLSGHSGAIRSVAYRPDGKLFASASADKTVKLWDVATSRQVRVLKEGTEFSKWFHSVAFSPDGAALLTGSTYLRLWDVATGALIRTGETSDYYADGRGSWDFGGIRAVFSPNGKTVAMGSQHQAIRIYETATFRELARPCRRGQMYWPAATMKCSALRSRAIVQERSR